jgi:hypothetical protein
MKNVFCLTKLTPQSGAAQARSEQRAPANAIRAIIADSKATARAALPLWRLSDPGGTASPPA